MGFGVNARLDTDDWIYQGNFSFITGSVTDDSPGPVPDDDLSAFGYRGQRRPLP